MNKAATVINIERSVNTYACRVMSVTSLSSNTFKVELQSSHGTILDYHAGQYLQLDLDVNDDGELHSLFYSIANCFDPQQASRLELFIQNSSAMAKAILKQLVRLSKNRTEVQITLPMGRAYLQTDLSMTHILIAAGSGISKIKCLTEEILKQQSDTSINIYWSNKSTDDFYLLDEFQAWVDSNHNLNFTPILESTAETWLGRSGYIYELIEKDFEQLDDAQVYLCGSPQMVYGTIDKLKAAGLKEEHCYSDVFEYAPRN